MHLKNGVVEKKSSIFFISITMKYSYACDDSSDV